MIKSLIWSVLVVIFLFSAFIGSVDLHPSNILHVNSLDAKIFFDLRLPRVLFSFFAGAILAMSGLLFQTLFRNALMTPYTLGISSGAVLGAGIAIKLSLGTLLFGFAAISVFGFFGALFTVFLLLYLAQFLRQNHAQSLLLLGIALSLFYTALLMVIFYLGSAMQNDMLIRFTMGSLSVIGWQYPLIISFAAIALFVAVYMYRFELQLLSISQDQAQLKGVDTKKVTIILLIISSFAIGILVSISGPIGFIGLIVPHIVQKLYPVSINKRVVQTTLFGGLFLVLCDTISRTLQTQSELPIGIITAIIGGPFFIYLIISQAKKY
ncbi:MAG TPA: iron ABC transporter permease [Sulfurimonas autotrophica]|nr:iron ABC transporter permease [Sulfurimonas autotrophica]